MPAIAIPSHLSGIHSARGVDRRRRRSTGFDRLAREQTEILAEATGNHLNTDRKAADQTCRDR
jgi:hypothetical protein